MCSPFSCIYHRTKGVLRTKDLANHSHSSIISAKRLKQDIPDDKRDWIRIETQPNDGDFTNLTASNWDCPCIDDSIQPDWFDAKAEKAVYKAVCAWVKAGEKAAGLKTPSGRRSRAKVQTYQDAVDQHEGADYDKMQDKVNALQAKIDDLVDQQQDLQSDYDDSYPNEDDFVSDLDSVLGINQ